MKSFPSSLVAATVVEKQIEQCLSKLVAVTAVERQVEQKIVEHGSILHWSLCIMLLCAKRNLHWLNTACIGCIG